jgi:DNA-binding transcriptional ArsR family regulator
MIEMEHLNDQALGLVAEYFRSLSDPMRLRILNVLRGGPMNVSQLTEQLSSSQANVSKHLATLAAAGMVSRSPRGTSVWYEIADPAIYELCDVVCGQLGKRFTQTAELGALFGGPVPPLPGRRPRRAN